MNFLHEPSSPLYRKTNPHYELTKNSLIQNNSITPNKQLKLRHQLQTINSQPFTVRSTYRLPTYTAALSHNMNRLAPLASIALGAPNNNNQPTLDDTSTSNETTTVSLLELVEDGLHNIVPYLSFGDKSALCCTNKQLNKLILDEDELFTFARLCYNFKVVDENGYDNLLRKISVSNLSSLEIIKKYYSSSMRAGFVIDGILELIDTDDSSVESDCAVAHGYTDKSATVLIKSSGIPLDSLLNGNVDSIGKKRRNLAADNVAKRIKSSEDDSTKSMDIGMCVV